MFCFSIHLFFFVYLCIFELLLKLIAVKCFKKIDSECFTAVAPEHVLCLGSEGNRMHDVDIEFDQTLLELTVCI